MVGVIPHSHYSGCEVIKVLPAIIAHVNAIKYPRNLFDYIQITGPVSDFSHILYVNFYIEFVLFMVALPFKLLLVCSLMCKSGCSVLY